MFYVKAENGSNISREHGHRGSSRSHRNVLLSESRHLVDSGHAPSHAYSMLDYDP